MEKYNFTVSESEVGIRIDKFLSEKFKEIKPEITRSKIQNLLDNKLIECDGSIDINSSQKTKINQHFSISLTNTQQLSITPKEIAFKIVFEDDDLMVIDKPPYLTVHPGNGNQDHTLLNALLHTHQNKLSQIAGEFRAGIVHRLDKDTSGLMLIAKNDLCHLRLSEMLRDRIIKRSYLAMIYGVMEPKFGTINTDIERSRVNRLKMRIVKNGKRNAITHYQTLEIFANNLASLVECQLDTGRTHQIRAHFEAKKHSLIGDQLYNSAKKNLGKDISDNLKKILQDFPRQALHSFKIEFTHPINHQFLSFKIDLPDDLEQLYQALKNG
ncbi:pseudouridine synthase [Alphaproteobacteria bacterium]|nr:pseudouridine synthase [Alphaproteobacteria bacterium]